MKKINKFSITILLVGLVIAILGGAGTFSLSSGYVTIFIAYPLILIGIVAAIVGILRK